MPKEKALEDGPASVAPLDIASSSLGRTPIQLSYAGTPRNGSFENEHLEGTEETTRNEVSTVTLPQINLNPARVGYFGYFFGCGAIGAYLGIIFAAKGFSPSHIGLLVASIPFFNIFLLPVLTYIADRYRCTHAMVVVCTAVSTFCVVVFLYSAHSFLVLASFIGYVVFQTPLGPLFDQHTLSMLPKEIRMEKWGTLRSYGAYGWGLGNPSVALLVEWTGSWSVASVQYFFGQLALLYCMFTTKPYEIVERTPMRFFEVWRFVFSHQRLLIFLLASCLMGMGYTFINTFLFIFLKSIGGSELLMGLSLTMTVSTEIPIFQYSKYLHMWFSDRQMISLAMFIWALRVMGYSLLYRPWLVMFLEPLHGVTFGLMWLPGIHMVNHTFPPHLASSATGFLYLFVAGIGPVIGNIIAGQLYELLGPRWMFRTASFAMLTGLAVYQVLDRILERKANVSSNEVTIMGEEAPRSKHLDEELPNDASVTSHHN